MGRQITLWEQRHIAVSKKLARDRGLKKANFENDDDDEGKRYEIPDGLGASHTA